jgi:curved DNA-binding protein CbpA
MILSPATALLCVIFIGAVLTPFVWSLLSTGVAVARGGKLPATRPLMLRIVLVAALIAAISGLLPFVSPMDLDPYAELGVPYGSGDRVVNKAYRRLSLTEHPDKGGNAQRFRRIARAYEALVDPQARMNFERYGNPEGENNSEAYGDFSKATSAEKKAVLATYLAVIAAAMVAAAVYGVRTSQLALTSETPEERAERRALEQTDAVPAVPGGVFGVPPHVLPMGVTGSPAALLKAPAAAAGASFYATFGPLFAKAATALKAPDASTEHTWPQLGTAATPAADVVHFYTTWRNKAPAKLKAVDYYSNFEKAFKKEAGENAFQEKKNQTEAWERFQNEHYLLSKYAAFRYRADQERLAHLIKVAEKADPRMAKGQ